MEKISFGRTKKGEEATLYVLENKNHTTVKVTDYGAALVAFVFTDKNGKRRDVVLGYDDVTGYEEHGSYFGATVGRNGNRIANSQMVINGKVWKIEANEKGNNLYSGKNGFNSRMWKVAKSSDTSITFSHYSPQEEQGFPGNMDVEVTYTITENDT